MASRRVLKMPIPPLICHPPDFGPTVTLAMAFIHPSHLGASISYVPASPIVPQLVGAAGARALRQAIAEPDRFACEPKVDGVRGLVAYQPDASSRPETVAANVATGCTAMPSKPASVVLVIACRTP